MDIPRFLIIFVSLGTLTGCSAFQFIKDLDLPGENSDSSADQITQEKDRIDQAVEQRDLVLGMPMNKVYQVWGEPRDVEIAGEKGRGNERWTYLDGLSQMGRVRTVYFERGLVVGWDTAQR